MMTIARAIEPGTKQAELCDVLGMTQPTLRTRLRDSGKFTVADIAKLVANGYMELDDVKAGIQTEVNKIYRRRRDGNRKN